MVDTPYKEMSFLVQPSLELNGYAAMAMKELASGALVPVEPKQIGGGHTPASALLRLITPLRESQPTANEAWLAFVSLVTRHGLTPTKLAPLTDYKKATIEEIINGTRQLQAPGYLQIARDLQLEKEYLLELRYVQRSQDHADKG